MSENNKFWWRAIGGKQCDLRELLWEMTKEMGLKKPTGEIKWDNDNKDFKNVFSKSKINKKTTIFTDRTIDQLVKLVINYKKNFEGSNIEIKITNIIINSKFNIGRPRIFEKLKCNDYEYCSQEERYRNCESESCFIYWIISTLKYIENNYWKIINNSEYILPTYYTLEDKKVVDDIYGKIEVYEKNFYESDDLLDKTINLFNSCIRCWSIRNVKDEKLAYVKWYTARLLTWPIFRACLEELEHYDERIVFELFDSASKILANIDIKDDELSIKIEIDRLTSYIMIPISNPFYLCNITSYNNLRTYAEKNLYNVNSKLKSKLAIRIWYLNKVTESENSEKCEELLCEIENEENIHLLLEYYLYKSIFDLSYIEKVKKILNEISNRDDEVESNLYGETYYLSRLFIEIYSKNNCIKSFNKYADIKDIYIFIKYKHNSPKYYIRIIHDSELLKYFYELKENAKQNILQK